MVYFLGRIASGYLGRSCGFFQKFVDQRLVGLVPLCGEVAQLSEETGRDANRYELFCISGLGAANAARALQLFVCRLREIRKIDSFILLYRLRALSGSRGVR
jgi:hypothetical protein